MDHYLLDVNETLSDLATVHATLASHGAPVELGRTWFAGVLRDGFALSLQGRAPAFTDLARQVLERCLHGRDDLDAPVETVVEAVLASLAHVGVHADVAPGIRAVTDAGHRLTAFSNGATSATRALLERAGVMDRMHDVLSVEGSGVWKPHPASYAAAAERLGVAPGRLTMVAVHPWDLDGAASAGTDTVWLDRTGAPWPEAFRPPGRRITGLGDLAPGYGNSPSTPPQEAPTRGRS